MNFRESRRRMIEEFGSVREPWGRKRKQGTLRVPRVKKRRHSKST